MNDNFLILRSMLIGTLLGDSHIGRNIGTAYITFEQALAKRDYLQHLYDLVKAEGFDMNPPVQYDRTDTRSGVTTSSLHFRTIAHSALNPLADLFLNEQGQKVIPVNIAEYLDIVVLSYWICDDGQTVSNGGVTLCTDSFSAEEIHILRDALMIVFALPTSLHRKGKRIYIGRAGLMKLQSQLRLHVHKSH